jgi:hypothetical protein
VGDWTTKRTVFCPHCGTERKTVELIIQARPISRRGSLATRAMRVCEPCGLELFETMAAELDRVKV